MIKPCPYCGHSVKETDHFCTECGGRLDDNPAAMPKLPEDEADNQQQSKEVPSTIQQLQDFARAHNLPLKQMRFFIGENYTKPKAFGIYQEEDGSFVVYKNKADGSRSIRYRGPDEAFAVNELYEKMRSEIQNQRRMKSTMMRSGKQKKRKAARTVVIPAILIAVSLIIGIGAGFSDIRSRPKTGYYTLDDQIYYYDHNDWYRYSYGGWSSAWDPFEDDIWDDYYYGSSAPYGIDEDFEDSPYYYEDSSDSYYEDDYDDWSDSDWDWDSSDSWDSSYSDWDSDW